MKAGNGEMNTITFYNKLVRDGMPTVISEDGHRAAFRGLTEAEFRHELKRKLSEEVAEYLESDDAEELADVWAVLAELAYFHSPLSGIRKIADLAEEKESARGGFQKRLFLLFVERPEVGEKQEQTNAEGI